MARGWESKSVEAQMELAANDKPAQALKTADRESKLKRDSILLSRARVLHEIAECRNQRYKELLVKSLEHLDEKLRELEAGSEA
jgi:hypothetical protein